MICKPHKYQKEACDRIIRQKKIGLFLDMGLGKTLITLTAIKFLIKSGLVRKVLIIAPLRVAQVTWTEEAEKWEHLQGLTFSKVLGTAKQREKALETEADCYIINRENVPWLCENGSWDYDMLVIDELSSFKSHSSERFKKLRKYSPLCKRVVGLTGTPAPNGLLDLWSQIYLLDKGERLGQYFTKFRDTLFLPDKRSRERIFTYKPAPNTQNVIMNKISDICVSMSAKDYLSLPERIDNIISVEMDSKTKKVYDEFVKEAILEFENSEVVALSQGVLINKLLQFANGCVYDTEKKEQFIHNLKLDALEEIAEFANSPILCFYSYKHDLTRILSRFPKAVKLETPEDMAKWNKGEIPLLLCHPASAGHGLNLQAGGHIIVWFGLPWSLELYQQANARLHRQGQKEKVIINHILCKNTVDERVYKALLNKENIQNAVFDFVKK